MAERDSTTSDGKLIGKRHVLDSFETMSTIILLFLSLITVGIYTAHYVRRQSKTINAQVEDSAQRIPQWFVHTFLGLAYLSAALIVPYVLVEAGHPLETVSDWLDRVYLALLIAWGFEARRRMNGLLAAERGGEGWFSGLWTFLFTPFYFNYKVTKLRTGDPGNETT